MQNKGFFRGVGFGMLAGAVVGAMLSPGKKKLKRTATKAVQTVENAAESISDMLNG